MGLVTDSKNSFQHVTILLQSSCPQNVFRLPLQTVTTEMPSIIFTLLTSVWGKKKNRYVYELWWIWWCLLIIDNSILACPDRMFSARIMFIEVPPHRGLSGTVQAGRKCLMMAVQQPSNGSTSETTRDVPALAALAYPKPKNIFKEGMSRESNTP